VDRDEGEQGLINSGLSLNHGSVSARSSYCLWSPIADSQHRPYSRTLATTGSLTSGHSVNTKTTTLLGMPWSTIGKPGSKKTTLLRSLVCFKPSFASFVGIY
jgi:hypothetical protein